MQYFQYGPTACFCDMLYTTRAHIAQHTHQHTLQPYTVVPSGRSRVEKCLDSLTDNMTDDAQFCAV